VAERRANPGGDLITELLNSEIDGEPYSDENAVGAVGLLVIAGIDTTWSAIGSSLLHFATHPEDRARWIEDPDVRPLAIEELLRFYAPVTMARLLPNDIEFAGCSMKAGEWLLLPFASANRDPAMFEDPDTFVIDRKRNRHAAFGLGPHRCAGSNLARMEMRIAIEEWLNRIPDFEVSDPEGVTFSVGQVRGPRTLPFAISRGSKNSNHP
jgi:cytochrome P450